MVEAAVSDGVYSGGGSAGYSSSGRPICDRSSSSTVDGGVTVAPGV